MLAVKIRASMQFLQDVIVCKFSHKRTFVHATCHIISYVSSQPPWFHANVSTTRRIHVRVRALKDGCVHTFLTYEDMPMSPNFQ